MLSVTVAGAVGAVLVFLLVLCVVKISVDRKAKIDMIQEKAGRAGGVAAQLGFKLFDDLCFAISAGNLAHAVGILLEWFKKYCQTESGPKELARDVIIACYPQIRDDEKYGNEVRRAVVNAALGWKPDQKRDIDIAKVAAAAERLGWSHSTKIAMGVATDNYMLMGDGIRELVGELMSQGAEEVASRVAPKTLDVLWQDANYRPDAEKLVREYYAKAEADQKLSDEKALARAAEIQAKG